MQQAGRVRDPAMDHVILGLRHPAEGSPDLHRRGTAFNTAAGYRERFIRTKERLRRSARSSRNLTSMHFSRHAGNIMLGPARTTWAPPSPTCVGPRCPSRSSDPNLPERAPLSWRRVACAYLTKSASAPPFPRGSRRTQTPLAYGGRDLLPCAKRSTSLSTPDAEGPFRSKSQGVGGEPPMWGFSGFRARTTRQSRRF